MIFITLILFLIILFLILLIPVEISIIYNVKNNVYVSYLFFKISIDNKNSKKQKKVHSHKNGSILKKIKKYINIFEKIIKNRKIIVKIIREVLRNVNFERAFVEISISSSEAKDCAMNFYFVKTFIYYFINLFKIKNNIKSMNISIFPSFLSENSKIKLDLKFKIVPIYIMFTIVKSLILIKN